MNSPKNTFLDCVFARYAERFSDTVDLDCDDVRERLLQHPHMLAVLEKMEETGGEPCVVKYDASEDAYIFMDTVKESPKLRSSVCYDRESRISRKKFPPESSALEMCETIGCELLDQDDYGYLQSLVECDLKTSSWIKTSDAIRNLGGALFGDKRYNTVFFYHNGADSYYGSRGFRGKFVLS